MLFQVLYFRFEWPRMHLGFSSLMTRPQDGEKKTRCLKVCSCSKGEYIFKQKDSGSLFFIIRKGKVRLEINDKKIKTLEKGEYFGELSLLYTAPRSASALAETDCEMLCLQRIF